MIPSSVIDKPKQYEFHYSTENLLPVRNITLDDGVDRSVIIKKYILRHLDDENLELIVCDSEDVENLNSFPNRQTKESEALEIEFENKTGNIESRKNPVEVPITETNEEELVIEEPLILNNKLLNPINVEKPVLNVTVYSCIKCKEQFNNITLFRKHLKWHKSEKSFNCPKCSAGFNIENNLKIHMVTGHPGHADVCSICKIKFQRKASLKSHMLMHQIEELFNCEECHAEFQNEDELLKHMEIHAVLRVTKNPIDSLVCPYCKLDFNTLADYKQHIAKHVAIKRNVLKGKKSRKRKGRDKVSGHKCKFCGKMFPKICLLERHERIHTGEKPYVCTYCTKAFAQKGTLQIHLGSHTGNKPYSCTLCPAKFTQKGNLRAHIDKTHTAPKGNQKMYKCTQCACIFKKIATLNGHVTKVHLNKAPEQESDPENVIDQVMSGLKMLHSALGRSALKKNNVKPASLPSASVPGAGLVKLAESQVNGSVRRYLVRQKKIDDVRWYFCHYCSSRFKKPSDLIRHFRTHTQEKPYQCTKCNQAFSLKTTLLNHHKTHNNPGCKCSYCDCRFRNRRNLNAHIRRHEKNRAPNFVCILCKNVFASLEEAKEHRPVHETEIGSTQNIIEPILKQPLYQTPYGSLVLKPPKPKLPNTGTESPLERPHHCKICDARFTRLISLKRHFLQHTGERKFKCTLCPKAFITKYRLTEHLNYHKNIRNYTCLTCGKKFVTASLLKRHTIVHNNFKPYLCPYCSKTFKTLLLCRTHIRNVHKLNVVEVEKESSVVDTRNVENDEKLVSNSSHIDAVEGQQQNQISAKKEDTVKSMSHPQPVVQSPVQTNTQFVLNLTSQENQHELNPAYQMVYLNISDLQIANNEAGLNVNNTLRNEALLFNDLHDSAVLFNIDPDKPELVDPNEVIKSTSLISGSLCDLEEKVGGKSVNDLATAQREISTGSVLQEVSTVDLDGVPLNIINAESMYENLKKDDANVYSNDIFYNAQVLCVNCHKMYSDMDVFQKHSCPKNLNTPVNFLIQDKDFEDVVQPAVLSGNGQDSMDFNVILAGNETCDAKRLNETIRKSSNKKKLPEELRKLETSKQYACSFCSYVTMNEEKFRKHVTFMHRDTLDKVCKYCFKDFKKPSDLTRHLRTHTGERPFECDVCKKKFSLKSTLDSHKNTHNVVVQKNVCCDVCNANFTTKSSLKVHMLLHTGARPYTCNYCDQAFRTSAIRRAHERNIHLNGNKTLSGNKPKSGSKLLKSIAEDVANNLKNADEIIVHNQEIDTAILEGPQDPITLDPMSFLQNIQNSGIIIATDNEGTIPLNLSDITLLDYKTLEGSDVDNAFEVGQHCNSDVAVGLDSVNVAACYGQGQANREQVKPQKIPQKVECDICHKLYASKDVLRKHKKNVHGQNRKFPCIKCDKGYDNFEELKKHIVKLHTGYRPYACQYCANSFGEENSLKTHIKRIHQKSLLTEETTSALLGLQFDLPMI